MSIQIDNGDFTRIHNDILDGLAKARFAALEFRCLFFLVRMTYGWQKKEDAISLKQWATGIGLDDSNRGNILNTLNGLVAKGVIYTRSNGKTKPATWGLIKAYFEKPTVMQPHNSKEDATVMQPHNSVNETVMPEDNSAVMQPHNKTVMQPHNHQRKERKIKEKGESAPPAISSPSEPSSGTLHFKSRHLDIRHFVGGYIPPGAGINAVEVYYERFSISQSSARLNSIKEDDLAHFCTDLDKLREVVTAYSRTAFQLGNLRLIMDWYKDGIPDKHKPPGANGAYKNGSLSESEKSKIVTRAKTARTKIRTAEQFNSRVDPAWIQDVEVAKEHGL